MARDDLKGRVALVTGASSGLGVAFARLLAARGADLIITARRKENLEALEKELEEKHGVSVDVSSSICRSRAQRKSCGTGPKGPAARSTSS